MILIELQLGWTQKSVGNDQYILYKVIYILITWIIKVTQVNWTSLRHISLFLLILISSHFCFSALCVSRCLQACHHHGRQTSYGEIRANTQIHRKMKWRRLRHLELHRLWKYVSQTLNIQEGILNCPLKMCKAEDVKNRLHYGNYFPMWHLTTTESR